MTAVGVGGVLLTGGASRRMGTPKAALVLAGETLAVRAARVLGAVCDSVVEVGPGWTDLPSALEDPPGSGPLAALVAGADALGNAGPVLLLACDLPFVEEELLALLVHWPGSATVVPIDAAGVAQPVCARYSAVAIVRARVLLADGERSLQPLVNDPGAERVSGFPVRALTDVDTPDTARELGLELPQ